MLAWLTNLNERDRRALGMLIVIVPLTLLYLLFSRLDETIASKAREITRLEAQLSEMQVLASVHAKQSTQGNRAGSLPAQLNRIASSVSITYSTLQPMNGGARVVISGVSQSKLLAWLSAMGRQGYSVSSLTIAPSSSGELSLAAFVVAVS